MTDVLLWDQFSIPGTGAFSQLVSNNTTLSSLGCDDFVVPADEIWGINLVRVRGYYVPYSELPTTLNVNFYMPSLSDPLLPEADPFIVLNDLPFIDDGSGNFEIPLNDSIIITSGHFWVSVQVNLDTTFDLTSGGLVNGWFWAGYATGSDILAPSVWKNPNNGFGTDAVAWTNALDPIPKLDTTDFNFQLVGTREIIPPPCLHPSTEVETIEGKKLIKDVIANDLVLNHKGKAVKVVYNIIFNHPRTDKFVIVPKDSIEKDMPSKDVLIRKSHPILYKGREVDPLKLAKSLDKTDLIKEIKIDELSDVYSLCTKERAFINMQGLLVATWEQDDWENRACKKVVRVWSKQ